MKKTLLITAGLVVAGVVGFYLAYAFSRSVPTSAQYPDSYTYNLLFKPGAWLIPIMAFLGIFLRAIRKPAEDESPLKEGKVLRHDAHMFLSHWSHMVAVLFLMVSGLAMGPLWLERLVHTPEASGFALNLHFIGVIVFAFAFCYFVTDLILKRAFKELLPGPRDITDAVIYYTSKIGIGQKPEQGKYLASEKLAFPLWVVFLGGLIITGGFKVAAHLWTYSSDFMGTVTHLHDVCALALLVLVAIHVLLGSLVPWAWPLLKSMVTGYMNEEYVRENHALWLKDIESDAKG